MSYYGTGDYYGVGDPGLLSSIGGFIKTAARGVGGFLAGGPVGAVGAVLSGSVGGGVPRGIPSIASSQLPPIALPLQVPPGGLNPRGIASIAPMSGQPGMAPKGYHLNKSGYFLKSGQYVAPGTRYVRNRTRNFANGKALNRAISRTAGFNRLVKRSRKNLRALAKI